MNGMILFVCTGNTCRSPLAEVLAREGAARCGLGQVEVASAGTFAVEGQPASALAVKAASRRGLDLSGHRSRPLTAELIQGADMVVAMTPAHLEAVVHLAPGAGAALATQFLPAGHPLAGTPVPDPLGGSEADYERTAAVLGECVESIFEGLGRWGGEGPEPEQDG
jgi:protein-tyrosine-phosphatase